MIVFHSNTLNFSIYVEFKDTLTETILYGLEKGLYGMMFHLGSLRSTYRRRIDIEDLVQSMTLTTRFPVTFFSRLPTIYNFCGSAKFLAWNGNQHQDEILTEQLCETEYELNILSKLGGNVITSCGFYPIQSIGLETCIQTLNRLKFKLGHRLLLENGKDKHAIATTLQDLYTIYSKCFHSTQMHIGCCLNLKNFHDSGCYDLYTSEGIRTLIDEYTLLFKPIPPGVIVIEGLESSNAIKEIVNFCLKESIPIVSSESFRLNYSQKNI